MGCGGLTCQRRVLSLLRPEARLRFVAESKFRSEREKATAMIKATGKLSFVWWHVGKFRASMSCCCYGRGEINLSASGSQANDTVLD